MIDLFTVRRPEVLGAVTHVDGTARVQTVTEAAAPRYYRLIERFGRLTQVPVLLNTSFNLSDEPIVCTPEDALRTFLRSALDLLCIEDCLLEAVAVPAALREAGLEEHRFVVGPALSSSSELYSFF
jgi:carbamoyltransferase